MQSTCTPVCPVQSLKRNISSLVGSSLAWLPWALDMLPQCVPSPSPDVNSISYPFHFMSCCEETDDIRTCRESVYYRVGNSVCCCCCACVCVCREAQWRGGSIQRRRGPWAMGAPTTIETGAMNVRLSSEQVYKILAL